MFDIGSAIGGSISGILGAGASILNSKRETRSQEKVNEANIALQREMNQQNQANWESEFNYTKEQNDLTRQREDNALQRKVQDAELAGLSPLASLGSSGANASVVSNPNPAPQMLAPQIQAPSFQADLQMQQALLDFASQAILDDKKLSSQEKITQMNNSAKHADLLASLSSAEKIAKASNDNQLLMCTKQVNELARSNSAKEHQAKLDYMRNTVDRITDGKGRFSYGHSAQDCKTHNDEIAERYATFVNSLGMDSSSVNSSQGSSSSRNASAGISVISGGVGESSSSDSSSGSSYSQSTKLNEKLRAFWLHSENTLWFE